jgi:hypothetical protein
VPDARRLRILARLSSYGDRAGGDGGARRLCDACADVTSMSGAGIMVLSGDLAPGPVCTTDPVSELIEDLQFTLGEGPCLDAYRDARPVLEPDLLAPATARWPAFSPAACDAGVRAVFGFPLQVSGVRLGALNLYRDRSGPLGPDQHADALAAAELVGEAVLTMQALAPSGHLARQLEAGAGVRLVVHQASGMVAAQLDVGVDEALLRLRAYAFGHERGLTDVARDVVARRLRFAAPDGDGTGAHP